MKNEPQFYKTVGILVKAYQNDTLEHGNCLACAVGNLICANKFDNNFREWKDHWNSEGYNWSVAFYTDCGYQSRNESAYRLEKIKNQIDSTGYSFDELAIIEYAFETAPKSKDDDDWMFNGLMAVVDCLMQIHEATETEATAAKELFIKA